MRNEKMPCILKLNMAINPFSFKIVGKKAQKGKGKEEIFQCHIGLALMSIVRRMVITKTISGNY